MARAPGTLNVYAVVGTLVTSVAIHASAVQVVGNSVVMGDAITADNASVRLRMGYGMWALRVK